MPPGPDGATVIGTRTKTTPDMAAFVNATAARHLEANDIYHRPGSRIVHPSDSLMPVLAAAEHAQASGREFITGVVLAYEVCLRIADAVPNQGVDAVTFNCLATAVASARLLGLSREQVRHAISMAVVPNNVLRWKTGRLSMWRAAAAGQAGREGVFAALLAREGMDSPPLPFEGRYGWCSQVAQGPLSLDTMGGRGCPFKVQEAMIKPRAFGANVISSIFSAEKVAPALKGAIRDVKRVVVEVYRSRESAGSSTALGEHHWNPDSRETADHSIPYTVASALMDGRVTPQSFDDAHLRNADLRGLIRKIEVVENDEFTKAYERVPVEHRTRVTIETASGERFVGESGGDWGDDLSDRKSDAQIAGKFRELAGESLGENRVRAILGRLETLEDLRSVAELPAAFVLD
jgi:2-methylcitrate dehydratase